MTERQERFSEIYNDIATYPTMRAVAEKLGMSYKRAKTFASEIRRAARDGRDVPVLIDRSGAAGSPVDFSDRPVDVPQEPSKNEPIEELIGRMMRHSDRVRKREKFRDIVDLNIRTPGPIGVVGIPDPHLNSAGTNVREAFRVAETIQGIEGLFCVGIGDWLDNFIIGRMERLRREDVISHTDAWRVQEHFVMMIITKLIAAIGGNHNAWIEQLSGIDSLARLFKDEGLGAIYDPDQVRVRLNLPDAEPVIHMVRHEFPGHSKYHPTHGILVWMLERWQGEDVFWGGHIHSAGEMTIQRDYMGVSKTVRGVQLSTYKDIDRYTKTKGFRVNTPFQTPIVIHDPRDGSQTFFEDFDKGVAYLAFLRSGS